MANAPKEAKAAPPKAPKNSSGLVPFLMITVSTFTLAVVGMLFATGAAQKAALPRIRAAIAQLQKPKADAAAPDSARTALADSSSEAGTPVAWSAGSDSLNLLRDQIDIAMRELEANVAERAAQESAIAGDSVTAQEVVIDSSAVRDLARLVKVMESMKPADAARLLDGVNDTFTIDLVRRLKERQAAKVMTHLAPAKAHAVAVALGRGAGATP